MVKDGLNIKGLHIAYLIIFSLRNKIQDILEEKKIFGEKNWNSGIFYWSCRILFD